MLNKKWLFLATIWVAGVSASEVVGQAFCALRDPSKILYEFYPEATSYKSLVKTVDDPVREYVSSKLPFTIHFNELGKHTLYLPVQQSRPMGVVHVRSESGDYGLTEIVWSLTPNLEIKDYEFQRCRSRARTYVESEEFKRQIIGKRFHELRALLDTQGQRLVANGLSVGAGSEDLALSVVRSALKTIAVSQTAWRQELTLIQYLYNAQEAFPSSTRVQKIDSPYDQRTISEFNDLFVASGGPVSSIDRQNVQLIQALGSNGEKVGFVVKTHCRKPDGAIMLWWTVDNGTIKNVHAEDGWPDGKTADAFREAIGLNVKSLGQCSSFAKIVAAEVLILAKHH